MELIPYEHAKEYPTHRDIRLVRVENIRDLFLGDRAEGDGRLVDTIGFAHEDCWRQC